MVVMVAIIAIMVTSLMFSMSMSGIPALVAGTVIPIICAIVLVVVVILWFFTDKLNRWLPK
jgi:hypothetical protein